MTQIPPKYDYFPIEGIIYFFFSSQKATI